MSKQVVYVKQVSFLKTKATIVAFGAKGLIVHVLSCPQVKFYKKNSCDLITSNLICFATTGGEGDIA